MISLSFLWNKATEGRVVRNGTAWKKAGKVVTYKIVPQWSVAVALNRRYIEESPGNVK